MCRPLTFPNPYRTLATKNKRISPEFRHQGDEGVEEKQIHYGELAGGLAGGRAGNEIRGRS